MRSIIVLLLSLLSFSVPLDFAWQTKDGDDPFDIIFIGEGGSGEGSPSHHAPVYVPVEGVFYPSTSIIQIDFLTDLGPALIEIENVSTGEYTQDNINATQGIHPYLISGTMGSWTIIITLLNETQYVGFFVID